MNIFHRITATLTSKVSTVVAHVENHDAIVEAALRDTRAASAKARVRLMRVQKDGAHLRRRLEELQNAETLWTQRAVETAGQDEARALECVKRRNLSRKQAAQTAEALARHEELEREVTASVQRIEDRLSELAQQRNMMRSRHSAADALRVISRIEGGSAHGIEDIFDRWEMLITETEYEAGGATQTDALDTSFLKQEELASLQSDLAALMADVGRKE